MRSYRLDPSVTARLLLHVREGTQTHARLESLTPQERKLLLVIPEGPSNRQIDDWLQLAESRLVPASSNAATSATKADRLTSTAIASERRGAKVGALPIAVGAQVAVVELRRAWPSVVAGRPELPVSGLPA